MSETPRTDELDKKVQSQQWGYSDMKQLCRRMEIENINLSNSVTTIQHHLAALQMKCGRMQSALERVDAWLSPTSTLDIAQVVREALK